MRTADDIIPTRRSLLSRLRNWEDQESWKVFFDTYWKLIYNAAVRAGLTDAEAQDVVQETVIAVSKRIPEFVYDPTKGSFKSWLMCQTRWRIAAQFRKRLPVETIRFGPHGSMETTILEHVPDTTVSLLDALWDEEWERNLIEAALRRLKTKVEPKHYQIFDLCVRRKWTPAKIAKALKINRAKIYVVKHRVGHLFKKELLQLKTKPI